MKPQYELEEIWELVKMLITPARAKLLAGALLALLVLIVLVVSGGDLPFSAFA
jgi:hypothetical protein